MKDYRDVLGIDSDASIVASFATILEILLVACLVSCVSNPSPLNHLPPETPITPTTGEFPAETSSATESAGESSPTPTSVPTATPSPVPSPVPPTPTSTSLPATPTATSPPGPVVLEGPLISYQGVTFTIDPALGSQVFARSGSAPLGDVEFAFAAEGLCREVGCVSVYPVDQYREASPWGGDILDALRMAIEEESLDYFPTVGAAILLRAQTQHVRFENGAGIRAVVMRGQDGFFANNEAIVYDFHGLTDDGQYYVVVTFPVDAPILLSTYDPAENTNEGALPVPDLPEDQNELATIIREYNQEAEHQLDLLGDDSFTPDLGLLDALVASLTTN